MTENVLLVDLNDRFIGLMEKMAAHREAKLHRAVSVFLFNRDNQLLLHRRALTKYHSAGLWTNTVCTHPRDNESNKEAAVRRLQEEMGVEEDEITELFHFIYKEKLDNDLTEYEYDHVFVGYSEKNPTPEPTEVCEYRYVDFDTIVEDIKHNQSEYTIWFRRIVSEYGDRIKEYLNGHYQQ